MRQTELRSWLLCGCPSEAELAAARLGGADVVILNAATISRLAADIGAARLVVEVGEAIEADLDAAMPFAPWAILADCRSGAEAQRLSVKLATREARFGLVDGATRVVARLAAARSLLGVASFVDATPRLAALLIDADAPGGALSRSLVALAAAAGGVAAIDGATRPNFFRDEAIAAREAGFSGKLATTFEDVEIANAVFTANQASASSSST